MIFKAIVDKWDTHVHFRLFVGEKSGSLGLAGNLAMRPWEFIMFSRKIDTVEPQSAILKIAEALVKKATEKEG